jgi:hypothetical protein
MQNRQSELRRIAFGAYMQGTLTIDASMETRAVANHHTLNFSLFITSLAALKGSQLPSHQAAIPPAVIRGLATAAEIFEHGEAVSTSPSLGMIKQIMIERVRQYV